MESPESIIIMEICYELIQISGAFALNNMMAYQISYKL